MGGCFSSPTTGRHRHGNGMFKKPRKIRIRRGGGKKKRGARNHQRPSNPNPPASAPSPCISGSAEEVWFEPVSFFGSDSDEEEYHTVPDDACGYDEEPSMSKLPSQEDAMNDKDQNLNIHQHQALSNGYDVESDSSWVNDGSGDTPHKCFSYTSSTDKRRSSMPHQTCNSSITK